MHGQQIVITRRFGALVHLLIWEPHEMFSLPGPLIISAPAIRDCRLNDLRLAKVTLARGMRPGQDANQEKLYIELRAHVRPPM